MLLGKLMTRNNLREITLKGKNLPHYTHVLHISCRFIVEFVDGKVI